MPLSTTRSTAQELRRVREAAARQLRRAGRRPTRAAVDDFLWRRWYVLRDDVRLLLGSILDEARDL
ncbi:MAG: hypothetical protein IT519_07645 [Burkholderiales bacterium]|nr:hypothetical protein [Burkholderiales bacterium]